MKTIEKLMKVLEASGILREVRKGHVYTKENVHFPPYVQEQVEKNAFKAYVSRKMIMNPNLAALAGEAAKDLLLDYLWENGNVHADPDSVPMTYQDYAAAQHIMDAFASEQMKQKVERVKYRLDHKVSSKDNPKGGAPVSLVFHSEAQKPGSRDKEIDVPCPRLDELAEMLQMILKKSNND